MLNALSVDREVLAVLTALEPLKHDGRLVAAFNRLESRREFDVEKVLDIGTWSTGERALIQWAGALWKGHGPVDIGYIASGLGDNFLFACLGALAAYSGRALPAFDSSGAPVDRNPVQAVRGCEACSTLGPLLTGSGSSGRTWVCECGTTWAPQQ